jgi:hypothetical protein
VCAGCNMKSYSHGFISCNTIICSVSVLNISISSYGHSNSLQNREFITPHNCPPKLFVVPRQCTLLINQFGYYILLHKSSTDSYSLFVRTWLKRMPQGLPHMCHEPWHSAVGKTTFCCSSHFQLSFIPLSSINLILKAHSSHLVLGTLVLSPLMPTLVI